MKSRAKVLIQLILSKFGMAIVPITIQQRNKRNPEFSILSRWYPERGDQELSLFVLKEFWRSKSQLQQDLVALYVFNKIEKSNDENFEMKEWGGVLCRIWSNKRSRPFKYISFGDSLWLERHFGRTCTSLA